MVQIGSNAPLSKAILASGGVTRRGSTQRVDLIRMDREGRTTVKQLRYDPNGVLGSANNPLRNGDVVVVDRNNLTKVTDGMNDALQPLTPVVNAASVTRLLKHAERWQALSADQIPNRSQITPRFSWCSAVLKQSALRCGESAGPSASRLAPKSPPAVFRAV